MMKYFIILAGFAFYSVALHAQGGKLIAEKSGSGAVIVHEVQPKEGLYSLSRIYDVKVSEIAKANKFDVNKNLQIGEKVKIPLTDANLSTKKTKNPVYYTVGDGDNLTGVSNRFNKIGVKELKSWNKIDGSTLPKGKEIIVGYIKSSVISKSNEAEVTKANTKNVKGQQTVIAGTNVNIRKGPSTSEQVVGTAQQGEAVVVTKKINNDWVAIKTVDGKEGYISSQFLANNNKEVQKETKKEKVQTAKIYGTNINIRKGPSTSEEVIATVQQDDVVTVLKNVNKDWASVRTGDGKEGYIASQFLNPPDVNKELPKKEEVSTAKIYGTNINVRSEPTINASIVGSLQQDNTVTITKRINKDWVAIRTSDGVDGYISSQFLNPPDPKKELPKKEEVQVAKINGTNINIRKGPSTTDDIVATGQQGDIVTITKKVNDEWSAVKLADGIEGYVASRFLNDNKNESDANAGVAKNDEVNNAVNNIQQKIEEKEAAISTNESVGGGFFKDAYKANNDGKENTVMSGVFKTDRGWNDGKFYLLTDKADAGSIVKITNPENKKIIYAKVLGKMQGVAYGDNLDIRISDAAANQLQTSNTDRFSLDVVY